MSVEPVMSQSFGLSLVTPAQCFLLVCLFFWRPYAAVLRAFALMISLVNLEDCVYISLALLLFCFLDYWDIVNGVRELLLVLCSGVSPNTVLDARD